MKKIEVTFIVVGNLVYRTSLHLNDLKMFKKASLNSKIVIPSL